MQNDNDFLNGFYVKRDLQESRFSRHVVNKIKIAGICCVCAKCVTLQQLCKNAALVVVIL